MLNYNKTVGIVLCTVGISACGTFNPHGYTNTQSYDYHGTPIYPDSYENEGVYTEGSPKKTVVVPKSYHVSETQPPASFKDGDKKWVKSQDPSGYTIEMGTGSAATVANRLYKAPKEQRTAEVGYQLNGQPVYTGVYGSYPSYEAAQEAFNALPEDLKKGSGVKSWSSVQSNIGE